MVSRPWRTSSIGLPVSVSPKFRWSARGAISGGDVGGVAERVQARDEVREAVEELGAIDGGVGGQAAVAAEGQQTRLPRAHEPGVRRAHRMPVAAQAVGTHLGTRGQDVDVPAHVEDVLPGQALARDHVPEEEEPLEVPPTQLAGHAVAEPQRVGTEHDVTQTGQRHAGVMHRRPAQAGRLVLAVAVLAGVLVPDAHARRRRRRRGRVGHQQEGRDAFARLDLVADRLEPIAVPGLTLSTRVRRSQGGGQGPPRAVRSFSRKSATGISIIPEGAAGLGPVHLPMPGREPRP